MRGNLHNTLLTGIFGMMICMFAGGCATVSDTLFGPAVTNHERWRPPTDITKTDNPPAPKRMLQIGDSVNITVRVGSQAPMQTSDVIDDFGRVTLTYVGKIEIAGLTQSEAELAIKKAYVDGQYFRTVEVTVFSQNLNTLQQIYVTGEVGRKGALPYKEGMTLMQAIIAAGDRTPYASNNIRLKRKGQNATHNYKKIRDGKVNDPVLLPDDEIEVRPSWF